METAEDLVEVSLTTEEKKTLTADATSLSCHIGVIERDKNQMKCTQLL